MRWHDNATEALETVHSLVTNPVMRELLDFYFSHDAKCCEILSTLHDTKNIFERLGNGNPPVGFRSIGSLSKYKMDLMSEFVERHSDSARGFDKDSRLFQVMLKKTISDSTDSAVKVNLALRDAEDLYLRPMAKKIRACNTLPQLLFVLKGLDKKIVEALAELRSKNTDHIIHIMYQYRVERVKHVIGSTTESLEALLSASRYLRKVISEWGAT